MDDAAYLRSATDRLELISTIHVLIHEVNTSALPVAASAPMKSMDRSQRAFAPRIYYWHPLMAGPMSDWPRHLDRAREMGFDHLCCAPLFAPGRAEDIFLTGNHELAHPALQHTGDADEVFSAIAEMCRQRGLSLLVDLVLDRVAADSNLAAHRPDLFHAGYATEFLRIDPREALHCRLSLPQSLRCSSNALARHRR